MQPKIGEFTEEWILQEAKRQYREGQASIEIDPGKTALIIVDMFDEFVKPGWCPFWVPDATRQVPKIKELIDAFHVAEWPVIYLAYEIGVKGLNFPTPEWLMPVNQPLSACVDDIFHTVTIYEGIAPQEQDLVILKHCYSGFHGTELDLVLRSLGATTVVICGTMTNFCCGSTAREAFWHGYKVIFGSDVNSTDDPMMQEAELGTLRRGFARIMTADEIIAGVENAIGSEVREAAVPVGASE